MPILLRDLVEANATLVVRCRQCGKTVYMAIKEMVAHEGADAKVMDLVLRMRCSEDGMVPDAWIELDDTAANHEAKRRGGLPSHSARRGIRFIRASNRDELLAALAALGP